MAPTAVVGTKKKERKTNESRSRGGSENTRCSVLVLGQK